MKHFSSFDEMYLLVILISVIGDDVEEAELVDALGGRDDAEPVAELLLLQELLRATIVHNKSAICFRLHVGGSTGVAYRYLR